MDIINILKKYQYDNIKKGDKMKRYTYPLRITKENMEKLKEIANYNDRSINEEINNIIKKRIVQFEKENGIINYGKNQNIITGNNNTINN